MTSFYKRFCDLCAHKGKSASGVAGAIGLSNAAASGWKKGKIPNDTTLAKLADYFGVSVEYLLADNEKNPPSKTESELSRKFAALTAEEAQDAMRYINFLISQRGE